MVVPVWADSDSKTEFGRSPLVHRKEEVKATGQSERDAGRHAGIKRQLTWRSADQQRLLSLCTELAWRDSGSKQQRAEGWGHRLNMLPAAGSTYLLIRGSRWCISIPIAVVNKIISWGSWLSL